MSLELFKRIADVGSILSCIALILCLYKFPRRSLEIKFQTFGLLASVLVVLYVEIFKPRGLSINIPQNINLLPSTLFPLLMFNVAMKGKYGNVTIVAIGLLSVFALWNIFYGQQMYFNSHTVVAGGAFVILHCILFYYYLLASLPVQRLDKLPMFWFSAGYLTYYGGTLFISAAYAIDVFRDSLLLYWTIKNILRIVELVLIIVGLCLDLRRIQLQPSLAPAQ